MMKRYAAIDIGSNAIRLLIAEHNERKGQSVLKKPLMIRVPLRLGDDAFSLGYLSEGKIALLLKALLAFKNLMELYEVSDYMACATSAMREAKNNTQVIKRIKEELHLDISLVDGDLEAKIIFASHIERELAPHQNYLYIDVGGGSTELTLLQNGQLLHTKSFDIGTIRLLEGKVTQSDWDKLKKWLKKYVCGCTDIVGIGTGGNINKLFKLSSSKENKPISISKLIKIKNSLDQLSVEERIARFQLNTDRADVIVPAGEIYTSVMKWAGIRKIYVPKKGMVDGIVNLLFEKALNI